MQGSRKKVAALVLCLVTCIHPAFVQSASAQSASENAAPDKFSQMLAWLNQAMRTPGAYTSDAFAKRVTGDATLVVDGVELMRSPGGWASRFSAVQQLTDTIEIVLPARQVFQAGDRIYTYHLLRLRAQGHVTCMLVAGHAELRGDLISKVTLVQAAIDPATDKECWKR
jgi:hypothetical protein